MLGKHCHYTTAPVGVLLSYITVFHHSLMLLSVDIINMPTNFVWETDYKSTVTNMVMQNFEVRVKVCAVGN
jgi:hypothetical protein